MKLKHAVLAAAMAVAASSSFAVPTLGGDLSLADGSASFYYTGLSAGPTSTVGFDFSGLAAGSYALTVVGSTSPTVSLLGLTVDGVTPPSLSVTSAGNFSFFTVTDTLSLASPLHLELTYHVLNTGTSPTTGFSGTLTVSPVPEPETYALMLAGLGAIGFVARRRKA